MPLSERKLGSVCSDMIVASGSLSEIAARGTASTKWSELASKLPGKARYPRHRLAAMRGLRCGLPPLGRRSRARAARWRV